MADICGQPMATPEDRNQMLELHEQGYSMREIAKEVGWSKATVSRYLSMMGADTDRSRTAEATAARVRKIQERKIDLAEKLMDDAFDWQHRTWDKYEMVVASAEGPSHVYLDEPPLKEQESAARGLASTMSTIDQLLSGVGNGEAEHAKNVLTNLVDGLRLLLGADDGLNEHDRDHDYDINDDPDERAVDMGEE